VIVDRSEVPVCVAIAEKAKHLRELGMSDKAIARAIGVSDRTVTKAISPLAEIRAPGAVPYVGRSVLLSERLVFTRRASSPDAPRAEPRGDGPALQAFLTQ
jgi:hypothetical protein